jgi:tetratricopeptide (TPR) repeat protein
MRRTAVLVLALIGIYAAAQDAPQAPPAATPTVVAKAIAPLVLREDVEAALQDARRQGDRVALFFRAEWSPWAIAMERRAMQDSRVAEALKSLVVASVDTSHAPDFAERFAVVDTPTIVLLEADGTEIGRISGYAGAAEVAERAAALLAGGHKSSPGSLQEAEIGGVEALYAWIAVARRRGDLESAGNAARKIVELDAENSSGKADNALAFLGLLESRLGNWDRAYAIYSRMAELYPTTELRAHLLISLGTSASKLGLKQEAIAAFEQFLKEFSRHPDAAFARGEVQRLKRLSAQGLGG